MEEQRSLLEEVHSQKHFLSLALDFNDYDDLYAEKLDLLLKIRDENKITWSGKFQTTHGKSDSLSKTSTRKTS